MPRGREPEAIGPCPLRLLAGGAGWVWCRSPSPGHDAEQTQTRGELKDLNGVSIQSKIEMIDHLKGSATEMAFEDIKVNQGLDPKFFTRRNLEWGSK